MIKILYKQNRDGSLSLLLIKADSEYTIFFDSLWFTAVRNDEVNTNEYKPLNTPEPLVSLNEIRNDESDVFYLRMNNEIIVQISWIPVDGKLVQKISFFIKSMTSKIEVLNKTVYESAVSRFLNADEYEDLLHPYWE